MIKLKTSWITILQNVSELHVLPLSQCMPIDRNLKTYSFISEIIFVSMLESFHCPASIASSIVPHANETIYKDKYCSNNCCNCHDDEGRFIPRCILTLEYQGTNKVALYIC